MRDEHLEKNNRKKNAEHRRPRSSMQTSRIPTCREGESEVEKEAT